LLIFLAHLSRPGFKICVRPGIYEIWMLSPSS
jgi:hypothetical protein